MQLSRRHSRPVWCTHSLCTGCGVMPSRTRVCQLPPRYNSHCWSPISLNFSMLNLTKTFSHNSLSSNNFYYHICLTLALILLYLHLHPCNVTNISTNSYIPLTNNCCIYFPFPAYYPIIQSSFSKYPPLLQTKHQHLPQSIELKLSIRPPQHTHFRPL